MKFNYNIKELKIELLPILKRLQEEIYNSCRKTIRTDFCAKINVSEIIKPFKHLIFEDSFKLISYSRSNVIGTIGSVVAVNNNEEPIELSRHKHKISPDIYKPYTDIMFCDGTPEGYFETIIFIETINCLFNRNNPFEIFAFIPDKRYKKKDFLFKPKDWSPKYYKDEFNGDNISLIRRSSGCLYLYNYRFNFKERYTQEEIININKQTIWKEPCEYKPTWVCIYYEKPSDDFWNIF